MTYAWHNAPKNLYYEALSVSNYHMLATAMSRVRSAAIGTFLHRLYMY